MTALIQRLLSYPVIVFTALMGVALLYWLSVIFGALDVDVLDADGVFEGGAEGAADAAFEGVAEGAFEGAADAAFEGAADAAFEGAAEGAFEGSIEALEGGLDGAADGVEGALDGASGSEIGGAEGITGLLSALNLRRAPVTVVFSLVVLFGWIMSFAASRTLLPLFAAVMPLSLAGTLLMVMCVLLALPLASVATKPLEPVFRVNQGKRRGDFVGQICQVRTGRVDANFGQAELDDGGAGLVIQVRSDAPFKRGQRGLIIEFDDERQAYLVEPYDDVVGEEDEYVRRMA